jgi:hypothetical protein
VPVEKVSDELWIGVKGQSNLEISCTLRNNFRVSLGNKFIRGRALNPRGGAPSPTKGNQTPNTSEHTGR